MTRAIEKPAPVRETARSWRFCRVRAKSDGWHRTCKASSGAATDIQPLYGGLDSAEQDAAIRPALKDGRRKVVLATPVAESSITIDGVRIVIDSGLVPGSRSMNRRPASQGSRRSARRGPRRISARAGPGAPDQASPSGSGGKSRRERCLHLRRRRYWRAISPPWCSIASPGASRTRGDLRFVDPPPGSRRSRRPGCCLLRLGALDQRGALTQRGKQMRALALPPRLAAMVVPGGARARRAAAELAVLLTEQGLGGQDADLEVRLSRFRA
jgi:ATP-dependent helicase HrpB